MQNQQLSCQCGAVKLAVSGGKMATSDCDCASCQQAGAKMEKLVGAPKIMTREGITRFELYRKDRLTSNAGNEHLAAFRLKDDSSTRRVVATCCNTPMFLDFGPGHWVSLYGHLWPDAVPSRKRAKSFSAGFMIKLLWGWAKMGFRSPKITFVDRSLDL